MLCLQYIVVFTYILYSANAIDILVLYTLLSAENINYLCNFVCNTSNTNIRYIFLVDQMQNTLDKRIDDCIQYDYIIISDLFNYENEVYHSMDGMLMETLTIVNSAIVYFCYYMIKYDFVIMNQQDPYSNYKYIYEFISFIPFHSNILMLPNQLSSLDTTQDIYSLQYLISYSNSTNNNSKVYYRFNNNDLYYIQKIYKLNNQSIENTLPNNLIENNINILDYRYSLSSLNDEVSNYISKLAKIAKINHPIDFNYHSFSDILCGSQKESLFHQDGLKVIDNLKIVTNNNNTNSNNSYNNDNKTNNNKTLDLIMCLTFTYEPNHYHIKTIIKTWGRKCDGYIAFSNHSELINSIIYSNYGLIESYDHMWLKTILMIKTIVTTSLINEYEYFLFGGDDLYIIIENLKYFLNSNYIKKQSNNGINPLYIGRVVKHNLYLRYNSGGSGYILNRKAVYILFHMLTIPNSPCLESSRTSMEDVMVGHCLYQAGIIPLDYNELLNENYFPFNQVKSNQQYHNDDIINNNSDYKHLFHPITPLETYQGLQEWYINRIESYLLGSNCCSNYSISFQSISPPLKMICLDYLIYHKQP